MVALWSILHDAAVKCNPFFPGFRRDGHIGSPKALRACPPEGSSCLQGKTARQDGNPGYTLSPGTGHRAQRAGFPFSPEPIRPRNRDVSGLLPSVPLRSPDLGSGPCQDRSSRMVSTSPASRSIWCWDSPSRFRPRSTSGKSRGSTDRSMIRMIRKSSSVEGFLLPPSMFFR